MKLLYIVPNINNEGGVARVLSIKTNYLIENLGYEVDILTQNSGFFPLFYSFNKNIIFHDMLLKGSSFSFFNSYCKALKSKIEVIQPEVVIVCDNGLKAFLIPFILKNKIPLVLEMHSSRFIEEREFKKNIFTESRSFFITFLKKYGINKYDRFVLLTEESSKEWNIKNAVIVPNPLWFSSEIRCDLKSKRAIAVGRHVYEKGFDRMLEIWQKVVANHPNWTLEIYGNKSKSENLDLLVQNLKITNNVVFHNPIQNINEKYLEASFCLMTSRFESFGMVLIEAMASGLPCVAYDCPCGPRGILTHNHNGLLIENGNESDFVIAIEALIESETLRIEMGEKAKISSEKYFIDTIMKTWNQLFLEIKKV